MRKTAVSGKITVSVILALLERAIKLPILILIRRVASNAYLSLGSNIMFLIGMALPRPDLRVSYFSSIACLVKTHHAPTDDGPSRW